MGAVQVVLLLFIFKFDTPPQLKKKGEYVLLREVMGKIYNSYIVEEKIDELGGTGHNESAMQDIGYSEAFCGAPYRRANLVGIMMAIFQQTTGINVIFIYSNTVFANIGWKP